jgi:hypothetical protein
MKNLFQNTPFIIGFWGVTITFLILNLTLTSEINEFSNIIIDKGFPFLMFREAISSNYSTYIFWYGFVGNIIISLVCSFGTGLIVKFIWSKITSRQML